MILKKITLFSLILIFFVNITACTVQVKRHATKSTTVKRGWLKNPNNPHHPNTTNPGKGHSKKGKPGKSHNKGSKKH